jgi:hypothetical protein
MTQFEISFLKHSFFILEESFKQKVKHYKLLKESADTADTGAAQAAAAPPIDSPGETETETDGGGEGNTDKKNYSGKFAIKTEKGDDGYIVGYLPFSKEDALASPREFMKSLEDSSNRNNILEPIESYLKGYKARIDDFLSNAVKLSNTENDEMVSKYADQVYTFLSNFLRSGSGGSSKDGKKEEDSGGIPQDGKAAVAVEPAKSKSPSSPPQATTATGD